MQFTNPSWSYLMCIHRQFQLGLRTVFTAFSRFIPQSVRQNAQFKKKETPPTVKLVFFCPPIVNLGLLSNRNWSGLLFWPSSTCNRKAPENSAKRSRRNFMWHENVNFHLLSRVLQWFLHWRQFFFKQDHQVQYPIWFGYPRQKKLQKILINPIVTLTSVTVRRKFWIRSPSYHAYLIVTLRFFLD